MNGSADGTRWERPDAPLGTLVYRAGLLSKEKLESALEEGRRSGRRLGEILLQKGWIEEKDLARLLAGQKRLPFVSLRGRGFDEELARSLPERVCRFHNAMAVEVEGDDVLVAIADPGNEEAVADIRRELGRPFRLVVATPTEIRNALDETFGGVRPEPVQSPVAVPPAAMLSVTNGAGDDVASGLRIAASPPSPPTEPAPAAPVSDAEPLAAADPAPAPEREEPEVETLAADPVALPELVTVGGGAAAEHPAPSPVPAPPTEASNGDPVAGAPPLPPLEVSSGSEPTPPAVDVSPSPMGGADAPPADRLPAPGIRIEHLPPPEPPREDPVAPPPTWKPSGWEPRIERNEEQHVSVAFHVAPEPVPAPEAPADPAPEPGPPAPEPVAEAAGKPVFALAQPAEASTPAPSAHGTPPTPERVDADAEDLPVRLVLELDDEEELDLQMFADTASAEEAAREFIARLARRDEWPLIGTRFIRPERIRSIQIRERQRFAGSSGRARWGSADDDL
jgi:hypothetical protein